MTLKIKTTSRMKPILQNGHNLKNGDDNKNENEQKNSAKRDKRPLKGMFNSPIYVHLGGEPKKKIFGGMLGKKFGRD